MKPDSLRKHQGSCHCGRVAFEVETPPKVTVDECNCSICSLTGFIHLIVSAERFRLQRGQEWLTEYTFGSGTAKHLFCRNCGIKSFYIPRSHPDGFSVNFRCLDPDAFEAVDIRPFDGRNWEQNIDQLRSGRR